MTAPTITWASIAAASLSDPDARFDDLTDALDRHPGYYDPIPLRIFTSLSTTSGFDLAAVLWRALPAEAARRIPAEMSLACALHVLPHVSPDERRYAERILQAARAHLDAPSESTRFDVQRHSRDFRSRAGIAAFHAAWDAIHTGDYRGALGTMHAAVSALANRGGSPKAEIGVIALRAATKAIAHLEPAP